MSEQPCQSYLIKKYVSYCIESGNLKVKRHLLISWVDEICYEETISTSQMVQDSFKYTGISCADAESEDYLFRGFNDVPLDNHDIEDEFWKKEELIDDDDSYNTDNEKL